MMSALVKPVLSPEEYLRGERLAQTRSEFHEGEVYAMSGGSYRHSRLKSNLALVFGLALRGKSCRPTDSDMRVHIPGSGNFTYPDLSIVCGTPAFLDENQDTLLNPRVIFEVLSDSTAAFDRGKKFWYYRHLDSLTDYVLVSQDEVLIEHYTRQSNGGWLLRSIESGERLVIESIGCEVSVAEVCEDIEPE
jgi:Uma2 family endonuclease